MECSVEVHACGYVILLVAIDFGSGRLGREINLF